MAVSVPVYKVVAPRFALWTTRSTLTLGVKGGIEGRAHGCRLGADGLGDRARYGRPAGRAALARRRGRAGFAGKYQAIPFVGAQLLGVAVCGARHSVRAAVHGEHAPRAQPSVKMRLHAPEYRQDARILAPDRAQRIGSGEVVMTRRYRERGRWDICTAGVTAA